MEAVIRQAGLSQEIAKRVASSILATRHQEAVIDNDAQLLVDVDLSLSPYFLLNDSTLESKSGTSTVDVFQTPFQSIKL